METGILEKKIRRKLLMRMLVPSILLLLCLYNFIWLAANGLLSMAGFLYPYDITGSYEKVDTLARMDELRYTSVVALTTQTRDIVDAGVQMTVYEKAYVQYVAVRLGDKYILCPLPMDVYETLWDQPSFTFTGVLTPYDVEVAAMVLKDMTDQGISRNEAVKLLYPYCITPDAPYVTGRITLYLPFVVLLVLAVVFSVRGFLAILDMKRYPGLKKLPDGIDPDEALPRIERQYLEASGRLFQVKPGYSICLARNWIIVETLWNIRFYLADELLWAFRSGRNTRIGPAMRTGGSSAVFIVMRASAFRIPGAEPMQVSLIKRLEEAYPWILIGYSQERSSAWYNDIRKLTDSARHKREKMGHADFPVKGDPSSVPDGAWSGY